MVGEESIEMPPQKCRRDKVGGTYIVYRCILVWCPFPDVLHVPIRVVHALCIGRKEGLACDF